MSIQSQHCSATTTTLISINGGKSGRARQVTPNNSFKPNLLRYTNNMAERACHVVASATQVGLTPALDRAGSYSLSWYYFFTLLQAITSRPRVAPGCPLHLGCPCLLNKVK